MISYPLGKQLCSWGGIVAAAFLAAGSAQLLHAEHGLARAGPMGISKPSAEEACALELRPHVSTFCLHSQGEKKTYVGSSSRSAKQPQNEQYELLQAP